MLLDNIAHFLNGVLLQRPNDGSRQRGSQQALAVPKPIGFNDFLALDVPPREMLLASDSARTKPIDAVCATRGWQNAFEPVDRTSGCRWGPAASLVCASAKARSLC